MEIEYDSQTTPLSSSSITSSSMSWASMDGNQNFSPEETHSSSFTETHQQLPENEVVYSITGRAIKQLGFIDELTNGLVEWKEIEQRFDLIVSTSKTGSVPVVNRSDFPYCIGMNETPEFADELLSALRGRKDLHIEITKSELHDYWYRICDPSFESKFHIFFDLCDRNMDGKITQMEIKQVILLSASANKLSITQEEAGEYAVLIMEDLDTENHGYIKLAELETLFKENSNKDSLSDDKIQVTDTGTGDPNDPHFEPMSSTEILFRNYWRRAWIVTLWLIICFALFAWKFIQYRNRKGFEVMGYCLCIAKGAAET